MADYGEPLTEREIELLRMVATGATNRQIAYRLHISVNTVKVHLRNIFVKLGAESRTEATMIAVREGWVVVDRPPETGEEEPEAEDEAAVAPLSQLLPQTTTQEPPLPWPKRLALVLTLVLVLTGIAVSWPRETPQAGNNSQGLPPDLSLARSLPQMVGTETSPWHERAQMPTRRAYLALAAWGDRLFAIAGQTADGATSAVEVYSPSEDLWLRGRDKPTPVTYVCAAVIGHEAYIPGGCDTSGRPFRTLEIYDMEKDSWREGSPLPEARCAYALAAWNGKLFLFGGWDGTKYVSTVFIYNAHTDSWSQGRPMDMARGLAAAA
ncbi:MAG: LuxR C-terminal-related transcriptional regulator, partial [Anaerolineae bacterium]|nr:LuxR C-terminal-related transcriptional regulator [Anaerolineae bacterium]